MADDLPKEDKFIRGVAALGKELGVSPAEALVLFGRMARHFIDHAHEVGTTGMSYNELVEDALNRFATGLGGMVANVSIEKVPAAPKEVH